MTQKTTGWIPDEFSGTVYSPRRKRKQAKRETVAEFEPSRARTAAQKESSSRSKPASKPSRSSSSSTSAVKPKKRAAGRRRTASKRKAGMVPSEEFNALVDERVRAIEQDLASALSEIERRLDAISDQALGAATQAKEAERLARENKVD